MSIRLVVCLLLLPLSGCSVLVGDDGVFRDRKKDYRKAESIERIQLPDHLDDGAFVDFYPIPPAGPYAGGEMIDDLPLPSGVLVETREAVRVQTLGERQWVLLQMQPSQLWPRLKEFVAASPMRSLAESGSAGIIHLAADDGWYFFRVEQGLQRNSAELAVRYLATQQPGQGGWPDRSDDAASEQAMLMQLARFLADSSERAAYSFAAQGISVQPRMFEQQQDNGQKSLLLRLDAERARASLLVAFASAGFVEQASDVEQGWFDVQFAPAVPDNKKPGLFKRLFGVKPAAYDSSVEYAGANYRFLLDQQQDLQRIRIVLQQGDIESAAGLKEANQQLSRIRSVLN